MTLDDVKRWRKQRFDMYGCMPGDVEHIDWLIADLQRVTEERDFVVKWNEACAKAHADEVAGISGAQHDALDILLESARERAETAEAALQQMMDERDEAKKECVRLREDAFRYCDEHCSSFHKSTTDDGILECGKTKCPLHSVSELYIPEDPPPTGKAE